MLTFFSGGTGTPMLLTGMQHLVPRDQICVVANTAEDVWISGTYLSPDVDSVTYALAGIVDENHWYGIKNDTFFTHDAMAALGYKELLRMGDTDRATKLYRTMRLQKGDALSVITAKICKRLGVLEHVFPMSDDSIKTVIGTEKGDMAFHDFWVRDGGKHVVNSVNYTWSGHAHEPPGLEDIVGAADAIVLGPSNPVTSISPILSIKKLRALCEEKRTIAISPMVGHGAFSGPAPALMEGLGYEATAVGVAEMYSSFLDDIVIDSLDAHMAPTIKEMGISVHVADINMKNLNKRIALGKYILKLLVI
ncbi:MAG: 2-phospho-L-lactate transferase [Candidatus Methanofastidiosia archaeon]